MKLFLSLKDDFYPYGDKTPHKRIISRGIIINGDNHVLIHHLKRDDIFGKFSYYETPGGGVDEGETVEEAVIREAKEETGYDIEILADLGLVIDEYRLINRTNENHFFLCRTIGERTSEHFVSEGDSFIKNTLAITLDEAISLYEGMVDEGVPLLVKRRELPFLKETKKILED